MVNDIFSVLFATGEPTLNEKRFSLYQHCGEKGYYLDIFFNCSVFDQALFDLAHESPVIVRKSFDAGTPEMDEFMERFESLRFRRSPLEPLLRILPSGTKATNIDPEKDYRIYLIAFTEDHEILLQMEFNIDQWYYGPSCTLPLSVSGGQETGRELGAYLWQYSQKILSD